MPKLKPSATEMMNREVRASLLAGQERKAMSDQAVATCIGVCKETYQKKKRAPEKLTLEEFRNLIKIFKIPDNEILRMVKSEQDNSAK